MTEHNRRIDDKHPAQPLSWDEGRAAEAAQPASTEVGCKNCLGCGDCPMCGNKARPAATSGDAPDLQQLYDRLFDMAEIIRADGTSSGDFDYAYANKSGADMAKLDEILVDAMRLCRVARIESNMQKVHSASATASGDDLPTVLFDGYAVYQDVMANDPHTPRVNADQVADVLDAVVRLLKKDRAVSAATKPTADLSALPKFSPTMSNEAAFTMRKDASGAFVKLADVQSLLATKPAAAPALPAEWRATLEHAANKLVTMSRVLAPDEEAIRLITELRAVSEALAAGAEGAA